MRTSESYKKELIKWAEESSKEDLIEHWELLTDPDFDNAWDLRYYATAGTLLTSRELIFLKGIEDNERVKKADRVLLEIVLKEGAQRPYLYEYEEYPLSHWWWYLWQIAERTYPAELLSEHLREIYLKALRGEF